MLLNCANSVLVRGVYIDAEEEGGQCVVFPCYYLRLYFQKERVKKRKKHLENLSVGGDVEAPGAQPLLAKQGVVPTIVKGNPPPATANHVVVHSKDEAAAEKPPHEDT